MGKGIVKAAKFVGKQAVKAGKFIVRGIKIVGGGLVNTVEFSVKMGKLGFKVLKVTIAEVYKIMPKFMKDTIKATIKFAKMIYKNPIIKNFVQAIGMAIDIGSQINPLNPGFIYNVVKNVIKGDLKSALMCVVRKANPGRVIAKFEKLAIHLSKNPLIAPIVNNPIIKVIGGYVIKTIMAKLPINLALVKNFGDALEHGNWKKVGKFAIDLASDTLGKAIGVNPKIVLNAVHDLGKGNFGGFIQNVGRIGLKAVSKYIGIKAKIQPQFIRGIGNMAIEGKSPLPESELKGAWNKLKKGNLLGFAKKITTGTLGDTTAIFGLNHKLSNNIVNGAQTVQGIVDGIAKGNFSDLGKKV